MNRNNTIQWTMRGVAGGVTVDLSRDDGATWTRLGDVVENAGSTTGPAPRGHIAREDPRQQPHPAPAHADLTRVFDRSIARARRAERGPAEAGPYVRSCGGRFSRPASLIRHRTAIQSSESRATWSLPR